jgi:hypothetical protein
MQDWEGSIRRFVVIAVSFVLAAVAVLSFGPSNISSHIPPNPGPSGTLGSTGSTLADPPLAQDPSRTTTGMAR